MKKLSFAVVFLLLITMIISLSGCGKAAEKAAQKGMEKALEEATGGKVDIANDGTKIEIDGQSFTAGDNLAWPKDSMGDLPEPKAKVTAVMKGSEKEGSVVIISEFQDGKGYVQKLKDIGYEDIMSMEDTNGFIYVGKKAISAEKSAIVNVAVGSGGKDGSITYSIE